MLYEAETMCGMWTERAVCFQKRGRGAHEKQKGQMVG